METTKSTRTAARTALAIGGAVLVLAAPVMLLADPEWQVVTFGVAPSAREEYVNGYYGRLALLSLLAGLLLVLAATRRLLRTSVVVAAAAATTLLTVLPWAWDPPYEEPGIGQTDASNAVGNPWLGGTVRPGGVLDAAAVLVPHLATIALVVGAVLVARRLKRDAGPQR